MAWKKTQVDKWRTLWENGDDWIILDKATPQMMEQFPEVKWEVQAPRRINPDTIHGKSKNFKSRSPAMRFAKSYMRKHPNG